MILCNICFSSASRTFFTLFEIFLTDNACSIPGLILSYSIHSQTNMLCIRKLWAHLSVHFMVKRVTLKLQVNKSNVHNCLRLLYMRRSTWLHISGSSLEVVSPHLLHFTEATNETNFFFWMFHICNFPFSTVDDETIL